MGRPCVCACGMGGGRWKKDKVEQSHHYQTQQYLLKLLPPPKAGSRYPSSRGYKIRAWLQGSLPTTPSSPPSLCKSPSPCWPRCETSHFLTPALFRVRVFS